MKARAVSEVSLIAPLHRSKAASNGRRDGDIEFGTNPCCEIILRPYQFCNLSEVICRVDDTMDTLKNKIKLATILGTFQSTLQTLDIFVSVGRILQKRKGYLVYL